MNRHSKLRRDLYSPQVPVRITMPRMTGGIIIGGSDFPFAIAIIVFAAFAIFMNFRRRSRAEEMIEGWATAQGLRILERQTCWFFKGPFFWTTSRSQLVYYVTVMDGAGVTRRAYVRLGGWMFGLLSDRVDVKWEY